MKLLRRIALWFGGSHRALAAGQDPGHASCAARGRLELRLWQRDSGDFFSPDCHRHRTGNDVCAILRAGISEPSVL